MIKGHIFIGEYASTNPCLICGCWQDEAEDLPCSEIGAEAAARKLVRLWESHPFRAVELAHEWGLRPLRELKRSIAQEEGRVIVSRHAAAVAFIRQEMPAFCEAPVLDIAEEEDVRGLHVAGNLPLHLAAEADRVTAVLFQGDPPRGKEYGVEEMREAGAHLETFRVCRQRGQPIHITTHAVD